MMPRFPVWPKLRLDCGRCASGARRSTEGSAPALLAFAQLDPPDLSCESLREIVDELDPARIRIGRVAVAHESLDLVREVVGPLLAARPHHEGLHDVGPPLVRRPDGRRPPHRPMLDAGPLDPRTAA